MTRWDNNAWGLVIGSHVTEFDFSPAAAAGCSFIIGQMSDGYERYNPHWADIVQAAYDAGIRVIGGSDTNDPVTYNEFGDSSYNWSSGEYWRPDIDPIWLATKSHVKDKWMQFVILEMGRWQHLDDPDKPLDGDWMRLIWEQTLKNFRAALPNANHRIKALYPMVSEYFIRREYPELGGVMGKEPFSAVDHNVQGDVMDLYMWNELQTHYPEGKIYGYDSQPHDNPPISYAQDWSFWKWGYVNAPGFDDSVGVAFYNGTREELHTAMGVEDIGIPDPEPTPTPEPEPEEPVSKPFGIDISRWQGDVDWDMIVAHVPQVEFIGIRATIGTTYRDPKFFYNWAGAKAAGILRTAYHVVYPKLDAGLQMDQFLLCLNEDAGELPPVLDVELDHGASWLQIRNTLKQCAYLIESRTGRKPIIYARKQWIDKYLSNNKRNIPDWINDYDWWIALYLRSGEEHPGPAKPPTGVDQERLIIHQTADHTPGFGVESKQLDYNRWQGTSEQLMAYANTAEEPETELTLAEKVELLWAAHPSLHGGA